MVESPGTAPGSEPFITGAFIAIVRASPNNINIGAVRAEFKPVCRWRGGQAWGGR
jgi:hypothetical protein